MSSNEACWGEHCFRLTVADLPTDLGYVPFSPLIDFPGLIAQAGLPGVLDPNSIRVIDVASGQEVAFARSEGFAYGDSGRIEWVIRDSTHTEYEICFRTVEKRPPLQPQAYVPMVGVGDLLRYNASRPRPIALLSSPKLVDLTGDRRQDLAGCWNYTYRPGSPVSGVVCYPRIGPEEDFTFGDLVRVRYVEKPGSSELKDFPGVYVEVDFADLTANGRVDMVFAEAGSGVVTFFLNTGARDHSGLPIFCRDASMPAPVTQNGGLSAVDLDQDGAIDLVVSGHVIRNANPAGWPFVPTPAVDLQTGGRPVFLDLDGDGRLDMLCLNKSIQDPWPDAFVEQDGRSLVWRKRVRDVPLTFGEEMPMEGVAADSIDRIAPATDGSRHGVLVQHNLCQNLSFYERVTGEEGRPRLQRRSRAESISAVMSLSDQAWPCICDWDGDGVWDMLIGGGYGWPRIVLNHGSNERPAFGEPQLIAAEGQPIRLLRDEILHSHHWHNMGYPYPVFVDWDGDGLQDLMLPNETNRIIWYQNIGTVGEPRFGPRQFLEVDGFPDSPARRAESGRKAEDRNMPNHPYPRDDNAPFFWRTGAAFADWNSDGLMDLITHDNTREATLFVQYRDAQGKLRLKKQGPVMLIDGRTIDDSIVGRRKHWTESFRAVDWNGNGLMDLIYSLAATGKIYLLENVGSPTEPVFDLPRELKCLGEPLGFTIHGPHPWTADVNGDGKPDLVCCVEWSVYPFFSHAALEMEALWDLAGYPQYVGGAPQAR